jgi:hypothetical protein
MSDDFRASSQFLTIPLVHLSDAAKPPGASSRRRTVAARAFA